MKPSDPSIDAEQVLKDYLSSNNILIIDSISSGRTNIASCLGKFGAQRHKMALVGTLHEAREELKKNKTKVIFADFMIGKESSLDLIQVQKSLQDQERVRDNLFVLVTSNASQSTVARAAEEDVDTFIIKPFSLDTLKKALMGAVKTKLYPSLYLRLIDEGKELLFKKEYPSAIQKFKEARDQSDTPTLACFYLGQTEALVQSLDQAEVNYQDGLSFNQIHYKCLVGLFDLLYEEKRYKDAYEIMKKLAQFFPANPKRLATVLRLSILTQNFKDIDSFYKIFVEIEDRSEELIRHMCAALAVSGRHFLREKSVPLAVEVFEHAAISAAGHPQFLLYIIETLAEYRLLEQADPFLGRLSKVAPGSKELLAAQFLTLDPSISMKDVVFRGRATLKDGVEHPAVYEKLINSSLLAGYQDAAFELADHARKKWPERARYFIKGFSEADRKKFHP
jgi:CheY-like chemotaxis protein